MWRRISSLSIATSSVLLFLLVLALPSSSRGAYCLSLRCEPPVYDSPSSLSVAITSPKANASVNGVVTVTANIDGTKNANVNRVEFFFDNQLFAIDTVNPFKADWNTLDANLIAYDGTHALTVIAYTTEGRADSAPLNVTVTNTDGTKYKASFTSTAVPQAVKYDPAAGTQEVYPVDVTITNRSAYSWSPTYVKLYYRWFSPDPTPVITNGVPVSLGTTMSAGTTRTLRVNALPPTLDTGISKAHYRLRFDLYDSATASWFAAKGNAPLENPIVNNKVLEVEALGLERYYHYEGEDVGVGMQHLLNIANGNSLLRWTPFSSPGRGVSTVVDFTYNSLEKKSESPLGNNWSIAVSSLTRLGLPLDIHPNKADEIAGRSNKFVEFTDGDGTTHRFTDSNSDGAWEEPPGVHLYLRVFSTTDLTRKWALTRPDRVTFFYDDQGYPTSVEDKNGNRITFTFETIPPAEDPGGPKKRITTITDAAGTDASPAPERVFTIDYYAKAEVKKPQIRGKIESITDHEGHALFFDYYSDGNLLRITQLGGQGADGSFLADRTLVFTYTTSDGSGPAIPNPALRVDPDPDTANQSTRIYSVRDPRGKETLFTYYGPTSGQLRWKLNSRQDRLGNTTTYAYDITNRVTTVTKPLSRVSKYAYDTGGKLTTLTNPKNETITLVWSADRHLIKITEPTGAFSEYAYNDNGYLTDQWDQLRNRTQLEYENLPVDANDVSGKWKAGRTIPHLSQLKKKTEPRGTATASPTDDFQWLFDYDTRGNVIGVTDPEGFKTVHAYNTNGTLASTTDPRGVSTSDPSDFKTQFLDYDGNGLPQRIIDAKGQTIRFGYDADGLVLWVQDARHANDTGANPREFRSYFDYDKFHRLGRQSTPKSTGAARGTLIWTAGNYDPNDNLVTEIGPHFGSTYTGTGAKTTTAFDAMDRPTLVTGPDTSADAAGERTQYVYDAAGRVTRITTPKGVKSTLSDQDFATFFAYDPLDRVAKQTRYEVNGSGVVTKTLNTHFCYSVAGDLVSVTKPKAGVGTVDCASLTTPQTIRFTWDAAHQRRTETDPLGHQRSVTYDANGNVATETNENGNTTTRSYDERDLLTKVVEPFVTGTTPRNVTTRYEYDPVGNLKRLITPRAWDSSGDKITFTEYLRTFQYDPLDRLVRIDLPTSTAYPQQYYVHRTFDANGNLTSTSLPVTTNDPAAVAADKKSVWTHFDPGWVRTSKEPGNPEVTFDYRAEGWQTSRTPAGGSGEQWFYYVDGLLQKKTDRGNQSITYTYDANNNLTVANDAAGSTTNQSMDVQATYDGFDQMTKSRQRKQGDANWRFTTYVYDLNGNIVERVDNGEETDAGSLVKAGRKHTFEFDEADWLSRQFDFGQTGCDDDERVENTYFATGWEKQRIVSRATSACAYQTKQTTTWDYFANGKLKTLTTKNGQATVLESHALSYEDGTVYVNGNRTRDVFTLVGPGGGGPCAVSCTATYKYDPRDRVVEENNGRGMARKFDLDPSGNITTEYENGTPVRTYEYVGNQLRKLTDRGIVSRYLYDANGNVDCVTTGAWASETCPTASSGTLVTDYGYDYLDRLSSYRFYGGTSVADDSADYTYDALDRLVKETEQHGGTTGAQRVTQFTHIGLTNLVSEERHENTSGGLLRTKSYSYDAFGHRIGMTNTPAGGTPERFTYGYDVHGSVSMLIDAAGQAKATYGYQAYGAEDDALTQGDKDPDNPLNPFRYSAKRYDSGSGSIDMGVRRFGPDTTRFLQQDLLRGALGDLALTIDPLTQNRYALAGGNPLSFVEVDGHMVIAEGGGGSSTRARPGGTRRPRAGDSDGQIAYRGDDARVRGLRDWRYYRDRFVDRIVPWHASRLDPFSVGLDAVEKGSERKAELVREAAAASAWRFKRLADTPSQSLVGRLPGVSNVRSAWYRGRAGFEIGKGKVVSGLFRGVAKVAGPVGAGLTFVDAVQEQQREDADDPTLSEGERDVRAVTQGTFQTAGAVAGASLAAAGCAATGVGAIVAAGCAVVGGWAGEAIGGTVGDLVNDLDEATDFLPEVDVPFI